MFDQVPLFSALSSDDLNALESYANQKSYRKNTIIISKGDESHALFVLVSGKVRIFASDEEGKEIVLNFLDQPGSYLGELALIGDTERTASAITVQDSKLLVLSKQDFIRAVKENPEIAFTLIKDLAARVRLLTDKVSSLALDDVYGRVTAVLREQAKEEDGRLITGRLTQQDIADMVGASREMISRIFKDLKAGGYMDIENKRIVLQKTLPTRW